MMPSSSAPSLQVEFPHRVAPHMEGPEQLARVRRLTVNDAEMVLAATAAAEADRAVQAHVDALQNSQTLQGNSSIACDNVQDHQLSLAKVSALASSSVSPSMWAAKARGAVGPRWLKGGNGLRWRLSGVSFFPRRPAMEGTPTASEDASSLHTSPLFSKILERFPFLKARHGAKSETNSFDKGIDKISQQASKYDNSCMREPPNPKDPFRRQSLQVERVQQPQDVQDMLRRQSLQVEHTNSSALSESLAHNIPSCSLKSPSSSSISSASNFTMSIRSRMSSRKQLPTIPTAAAAILPFEKNVTTERSLESKPEEIVSLGSKNDHATQLEVESVDEEGEKEIEVLGKPTPELPTSYNDENSKKTPVCNESLLNHQVPQINRPYCAKPHGPRETETFPLLAAGRSIGFAPRLARPLHSPSFEVARQQKSVAGLEQVVEKLAREVAELRADRQTSHIPEKVLECVSDNGEKVKQAVKTLKENLDLLLGSYEII